METSFNGERICDLGRYFPASDTTGHRDYQKAFAVYMDVARACGVSVLLCSGTGTGKTGSYALYAKSLRKQGLSAVIFANATLVHGTAGLVAGDGISYAKPQEHAITVFESHHQFVAFSRSRRGDAAGARIDVVNSSLVTLGGARRSAHAEFIANRSSFVYDVVIIDEAHKAGALKLAQMRLWGKQAIFCTATPDASNLQTHLNTNRNERVIPLCVERNCDWFRKTGIRGVILRNISRPWKPEELHEKAEYWNAIDALMTDLCQKSAERNSTVVLLCWGALAGVDPDFEMGKQQSTPEVVFQRISAVSAPYRHQRRLVVFALGRAGLLSRIAGKARADMLSCLQRPEIREALLDVACCIQVLGLDSVPAARGCKWDEQIILARENALSSQLADMDSESLMAWCEKRIPAGSECPCCGTIHEVREILRRWHEELAIGWVSWAPELPPIRPGAFVSVLWRLHNEKQVQEFQPPSGYEHVFKLTSAMPAKKRFDVLREFRKAEDFNNDKLNTAIIEIWAQKSSSDVAAGLPRISRLHSVRSAFKVFLARGRILVAESSADVGINISKAITLQVSATHICKKETVEQYAGRMGRLGDSNLEPGQLISPAREHTLETHFAKHNLNNEPDELLVPQDVPESKIPPRLVGLLKDAGRGNPITAADKHVLTWLRDELRGWGPDPLNRWPGRPSRPAD